MGAPPVEELYRFDKPLAQRCQAIFDTGRHDVDHDPFHQAVLLQIAQGLRHHLLGQAGNIALQGTGAGGAAHEMNGMQDHGDPFSREQAQKPARRAVFGKRGLSQGVGQGREGIGRQRWIPSGNQGTKRCRIVFAAGRGQLHAVNRIWEISMAHTALIIGATGLVGQNLANRLVAEGWTVYGLARRTEMLPSAVLPVKADTLDPVALGEALAGLEPSHVFFTTWTRRDTERENCIANAAMLRNVFDCLPRPDRLIHAALVTGLKHYLGPFDSYATGAPPVTPFRESMGRLDVENFYYAQEDVLFEAAARHGFSWSVHRPHTVIGFAVGNLMNMGATLAVYASLCRESGAPFVFPGSPVQWSSLTDVTDARQLASQIHWASVSAAGRNEAFNVVNGDVFRWQTLWPDLAAWFGIEAAPYPGQATSLATMLGGKETLWADIARRYDLVEPALGRLASPWHTDADLGRPVECVTDMSKSRALGFTGYRDTRRSFTDLFALLRASRLIP